MNVGGFRTRLDRLEEHAEAQPSMPSSELRGLLDVASRAELAAAKVEADAGRPFGLGAILRARLDRVESGALLRVATPEERKSWHSCRRAIRDTPDIEVMAAHGKLRRLVLELDARYVAASLGPADPAPLTKGK